MQTDTWRLGRGSKREFLLIVWSLSALYALNFYNRGWVPHDEGVIAQSAERVLAGEIPHRDFDEIYTGGLTYLHAAAFKAFGINLISLRIILLVCFLGFVPALYALATRVTPPISATAVTLLGVVWSLPNYFASVPSWYNLFFATFGTLALVWHVETRYVRWLFAAGLFGGLSVLAKITGVYYIAAAILFLTFQEQILNNRPQVDQRYSSRVVLVTKIVGVCLLSAGLVMLLRGRPSLMEVFHFLIPPVAICGVILYDEWQGRDGAIVIRLRSLCTSLFPFLVGVAIPIVFFVAIYISNHSIADLYGGVFVLPHKRFESASRDFLPVVTAIASLPYAGMFFFPPYRSPSKPDHLFGFILVSLLGVILYLSDVLVIYSIVWQSVIFLGVVAVIAGCASLIRSVSQSSFEVKQRQITFLFASMTAFISLVQFPFASPIYFCYTAPFVCLTLLAVAADQSNRAKFWHAVILLFYLIFGVAWANTGYIAAGVGNSGYRANKILDIPRGQLRLTDYESSLYAQLVSVIQKHSTSTYIYAAPDCPEIYFLAGMRNPTRKFFDFFSNKESDSQEISALLKERKINVVVINHTPQFSRTLESSVSALLEEHFPEFLDLGHFTVRWKE
jgi:hypothetical protein